MVSNNTYVVTLNSVIGYVSLYINFVTVIAGTIGGLCNLITYTSPRLRDNACVFYLLCASVLEIFSILVVVPTRIALDNFGNNLEQRSIAFCKLRFFCAIVAPKLVTYYILFATIDRYLASSSDVSIRSWSQLKVAHRSSLILFIVGILTGIHVPIFYTISDQNCQVPAGNAYTIVFAVYLIFIVSLLPYTLMIVFSICTFRNFKRTRQRVLPISNAVSTFRTQRSELQLLTLVVIQVVLGSILVLLRLGSYTYATITSGYPNQTENQLAAQGFSIRLGFSLYYFSFATSFYVSTLTRRFFRKIFWNRIRDFHRRCQRLAY